jgi:small subunit ribosomal protein S15
LNEHNKDVNSRRGLLAMVAKRRRLLSYLQRRDKTRFDKLTKDLGLKNKTNDKEK